MLAIATTNALTLIDPATLKRTPSSVQPCQSLFGTPSACNWSSDNSSVFITSPETIYKYDPSSNSLVDIHSNPDASPISCMAMKEKGNTLVYSAGSKISILEYGIGLGPAKVAQTFDSHKSPITSLSLSNDSTLLASTSGGAVYIHNLSLGSHTVLRGLTLAGQTINTCVYHPHSRTRLLVGFGKQLVIYDTTKPSGPIKTISIGDATAGDINAIACSPFSKTLIAMSTSGGNVGLVDLDKEKGLFRTLNFKVPLTSIAFSPEGAAIYVGTEDGKLLLTDLRGLDKPPKVIVISEGGDRVESISVQRKTRGSSTEPSTRYTTAVAAKTSSKPESSAPTRKPSGNVPAKPVVATRATTRVAPSPARPRVARLGSAIASPARRATSGVKSIVSPRGNVDRENKKPKDVLSPVHDPLGNSGNGDISVEIESLVPLRTGTKKENTPIVPTVNGKESSKKAVEAVTRKLSSPRTTGTRTSPSSSPKSGLGLPISAPTTRSNVSKALMSPKGLEVPRRTRTISTSSATHGRRTDLLTATTTAESTSASAKQQAMLPSSEAFPRRARTASSASRAGPEFPSVRSGETLSSRLNQHADGGRAHVRQSTSPKRPRSRASRASRSPDIDLSSPDLPSVNIDMGPVTPLTKGKRRGAGVLGFGTPEVELWVEAGKGGMEDDRKRSKTKDKGKGKVVGFKEKEGGEKIRDRDYDDDEMKFDQPRETGEAHVHSMEIQISPRRPAPSISTSWATVPSPLRHSTSVNPTSVPASPGSGSAHDFLRTLMRDVMYDFQRETRAEMMGLHLDLVRMGRGLRRELKDVMEEYVGDFRDLREENRRLREENERLRRGY